MTTLPQDPATGTRASHALLVALSDTLGVDFDIAAYLRMFVTGCVATLGMSSVGLLLEDHRGALELAANCGEPAGLLGHLELAHSKGPGIECHHTGRPLAYSTNSALAVRWTDLADAAHRSSITTWDAIPMRLRQDTIGTLTLLGGGQKPPSNDTISLARSFAAAATIGLINQRTVRRHEDTSAQLQTALTSRIQIEQAKGILAGQLSITVSEAFTLLRSHARANNLKLHAVAQDVIDGGMPVPAQRRRTTHNDSAG